MIALWMLGATAVPLDFRATAAERKLLASEFDLFAIIEDRRFPDSGYKSIFMDGSWSDQIGRHDASPLANEAEDAPALIGLTSGTTGRPVGIILDHERALLRFSFDREQDFGSVMLNPLASLLLGLALAYVCRAAEGDGGVFLSAVVFGAGTGRSCLGLEGDVDLHGADHRAQLARYDQWQLRPAIRTLSPRSIASARRCWLRRNSSPRRG